MIRLAAVLITAGVVVTVCGCAEPVSPEPEPPASWDPCTLSDALLEQAGFAAVSRRKDVAVNTGWAGCGWRSGDAAVRVLFADGVPLAQLRAGDEVRDPADITVAGRSGLRFRTGDDVPDDTCSVALPTGTEGMVRIRIDRAPGAPGEPACARAERTAAVLAPALPR